MFESFYALLKLVFGGVTALGGFAKLSDLTEARSRAKVSETLVIQDVSDRVFERTAELMDEQNKTIDRLTDRVEALELEFREERRRNLELQDLNARLMRKIEYLEQELEEKHRLIERLLKKIERLQQD